MHHFHRVFPEVLVPIKDNEHAVVNLKSPLMGIQVNHKSVQTIGPANKKIKKQALALEKTRLDANKERKAKIKGTAKMLNHFKNKCKYGAILCSFYMCTVKWAATRENLS